MRIIAAALAAALCAGCAHIEHQLATDAAALTSEHFKATATLKDDALDTVATMRIEANRLELRTATGGAVATFTRERGE